MLYSMKQSSEKVLGLHSRLIYACSLLIDIPDRMLCGATFRDAVLGIYVARFRNYHEIRKTWKATFISFVEVIFPLIFKFS